MTHTAPLLPPSGSIPPKTPEQLKHEAEARQLRMAYGQFFGSPNGQLILADLKKEYGFDDDGIEKPSYRPGMPPEAAIFNDAVKEPVRRILRMQALPEKPQPKPDTAIT